MGCAMTPRNAVPDLPRGLSQASCMIVSGFGAALDLDTYPLSNLIRPRCAEQAKPGRGKTVMFACFHAISLERSQNPLIIFHALVVLKLLIGVVSIYIYIYIYIYTCSNYHYPSLALGWPMAMSCVFKD